MADLWGIRYLKHVIMKHSMSFIYFFFCLVFSIVAQQTPSLVMAPYIFENSKKETDAEMGTLTVPANRSKADGRTLELKFVRFKSTSSKPGSPIVYLAGGPGGSGISAARGSRYELFMAMREVADVIAFDQRGTGLSNVIPPYENYWLYPFDQPLDPAKVTRMVTEFTNKATSFWQEQGIDLSDYNTNESADDLNDLRLALGAEKISLWSISYGSHLALATIKRHQDHLHKVILAGVEGLDHTVKLPSDSQKLLERIDSLIKADPEVQNVYSDFLGDLEMLLDKVEQHPAQVPTKHPITGQEIEVTVGKYDLQVLLANALRGPAFSSYLPYWIKQMLTGNFTGLSDWVLYTHAGDVSPMSLAMDVASGISSKRLKKIEQERETTLLSDAINFPYMAQRAALPALDLGESFRESVYTNIPVLCISGTLDGRTLPTNATEVLKYMPNGHHLIIHGAGHSDPLFLSSPKIKQTMLAFMQGNQVERNQHIYLPPIKFFVAPEKETNHQANAKQRPVAKFKHLNVSGLAVVYLRAGAQPTIDVSVEGMPMENLITEIVADTLRIFTKGNHSGEFIAVRVGVPRSLESIRVSGAGQVNCLDKIHVDQLTVISEYAGSAELNIAVNQLQVILEGGDLAITGKAGKTNVVRRNNHKLGTFRHANLKTSR